MISLRVIVLPHPTIPRALAVPTSSVYPLVSWCACKVSEQRETENADFIAELDRLREGEAKYRDSSEKMNATNRWGLMIALGVKIYYPTQRTIVARIHTQSINQ